jgi:hypothetical protein
MSTRCNIIIKDGAERIYLYHHHDGYPLGVGTELQDYLQRKWGESWRTFWYGTSITNDLVKGHINYPLAQEPHEDDEYEVTYGLHGDVEYIYVINCRARTIRCYSIPWDDEFHKDFRIQWGKVFTRRCLEHIPTIPEREAYIKDYEARQAARRAAAIR